MYQICRLHISKKHCIVNNDYLSLKIDGLNIEIIFVTIL